MIGREVALEALGVLCNAEVTVVNRSDESRGAEPFLLQIHRLLGVDNVTAEGAELFSIHHLIPRVLEADERQFTGHLQRTDEMKEINQRSDDSPASDQDGITFKTISPSQPMAMCLKVSEDVSKDNTTGQIKLKIAIDEKKLFDPGFDYDFTNLKDTETYYRGGEKYERPCGYKRFALKVLGKYEDNTWLGHLGRGTKSVEGEWPVSYHGTKENCVDPIIKEHLKAGNRALYGRGVYSTPDISEAATYAITFTSKTDGKKYKVILQNRINPKYRKICDYPKYYLIEIPKGTSEEKEKELVKRAIRPYGLLIKEV